MVVPLPWQQSEGHPGGSQASGPTTVMTVAGTGPALDNGGGGGRR